MRIFLFSFSLIGILFLTDKSLPTINSALNECCGKCVGSEYCTACTNCSRCAHCSGGGTCGVCSSGTTRKSSRSSSSYKRVEPAENAYIRFAPSTGSSQEKGNNNTTKKPEPVHLPASTQLVLVNAEVVNIRQGPGTEFEVVGKLYKDDQVTILENTTKKWVLIQTEKSDDPTSVIIKGYVYASFLRR